MHLASGRGRLARTAITALVAGAAAATRAPWEIALLIGWCLGAVAFLTGSWWTIARSDGHKTREVATREDNARLAADALILLACVASLVGVVFVLVDARGTKGGAADAMTALAVVTVILSWGTVHTLFTLRYAHLYWSERGGIDFGGDTQPDFRDFAYVAFTLGMTYQVSDTNLTTKPMRRLALRHALLSFLFGTTIIAVMINLVASLGK